MMKRQTQKPFILLLPLVLAGGMFFAGETFSQTGVMTDTLSYRVIPQYKSPKTRPDLPGQLRFWEALNSAGNEFVGWRAPFNISTSYTLTMPSVGPTTGQILQAAGTDSLAWGSAGIGDITGVVAGNGLAGGGLVGDVTLDVIYAATSGNADTLTLHDFIVGSPSTNDFIKWNGSNWVPASVASSIVGREADGSPSIAALSTIEFLQSTGLKFTDQGSNVGRVEIDTSTVWVNTKTEIAAQIAAAIASKQDDSDTTGFDASKTWVLAKSYLVAADISTKQDDSDTTTFDASKTWVLSKNYLIAADITSKQDDSDTTGFDATKTWVLAKGYLTAETGDISAVSAGTGLSGGGSSGAVTLNADTASVFIQTKTENNSLYVSISRMITAGNGLVGGGGLNADRTLDIIGTDGLKAEADSLRAILSSTAGIRVKAGVGAIDSLELLLADNTLSKSTAGVKVNAIGSTEITDNSLTAADIDETVAYNFSNAGNVFTGAKAILDSLRFAGINKISANNDTLYFYRKSDGQFQFKLFLGDVPATDEVLKISAGRIALWQADAVSGGAGGYSTIQEEGSGLTQRATLNFVGTSFTATDNSGSSRTDVTTDADLDALASNSTNGFWARTGAGTGSALTLTGTAGAISISNGDGSGTPTFTLPSTLTVPTVYAIGSDPADAGVIRLENAAVIGWEAAPAGTDVTLTVDASEVMQASGAFNAGGNITGSNLSGTNTGDVTLSGTPDYITISGQVITRGTIDISSHTNLTAGSHITLTGDDLSVDDDYVLNTGDAIAGNLDFNDGSGDSPQASFTPASGTAWKIYTVDSDDDLAIESASTASTENIDITNPGAGTATLTVEGAISASNFSGTSSGTNTGDQTITLTGNVTGSGTGSFATTIASNVITASMIANGDHGAFTYASNVASLDAGSVSGGNAGTVTDNSITADDIAADAVGASELLESADFSFTGTATFDGDALHIFDTDASHDLIITPGSNLTADHTLTLTTGDADRTLTINASTTLGGGTHSGTNTGDITLTGENYLTLSSQQITVGSVNLSGSHATGTLAAGRFPALTGDVTTSAGALATTIANDAVTFAKFQNITDARLLGRSAGSSGDMQEITVGTGLSLSGGSLTASASSPTWDIIGDAAGNGSVGFGDTEQIIVSSQTSGDVAALTLDINQVDDAAATDDLIAFTIDATSESGDAGDTFTLMRLLYENGTANTVLDRALLIDNAETTASTMTDAILITSSGVNGGVVDAIDVSAANITNAINIGANDILTAATTIASTELDLLDGLTGTIATAANTVSFTNKTYDTQGTGNVFSDIKEFDLGPEAWTRQSSTLDSAYVGTNVKRYSFQFDATTDEIVRCTFRLPSYTATSTTFDLVIFWYSAAATSGSAVWGLAEANSASAANFDPSLSAITYTQTTTSGSAGNINSTTITLSSPGWAAGDLVTLYLRRDADGTGGTDSLVGDAIMIGATGKISLTK